MKRGFRKKDGLWFRKARNGAESLYAQAVIKHPKIISLIRAEMLLSQCTASQAIGRLLERAYLREAS